MLPFLEPKKIVSVISSRRGKNPDIEVNAEVEAPGQEMDAGLKAAAEDLLRALDTRSAIDLAKAFRAAFEICDAYPHQEGTYKEGE